MGYWKKHLFLAITFFEVIKIRPMKVSKFQDSCTGFDDYSFEGYAGISSGGTLVKRFRSIMKNKVM